MQKKGSEYYKYLTFTLSFLLSVCSSNEKDLEKMISMQEGGKILFLKIVKNDFLRNKIVTLTVFVFITMAVILAASAINNMANLIQSMSELQERAVPADITQMHSGEFDQVEIDRFTEEQRENIAMQETMVLLTIDGSQYSFWPKSNDGWNGTGYFICCTE